MKKIIYSLLAIGLFTQCINNEGPIGPPGPAGFDGLDGLDGMDGQEAYVFEYNVSFTAPEYSAFLNLPNTFTMLETDVMLIYFLWEVGEDGTEVWRQLPQTLYLTEGILAYNYDFTQVDASIFLDGTVNFDALTAAYTDDWIARVVVVPGQFGGRTSLDYSDYDQVKEVFDLPPVGLDTSGYSKRPE